MEEVYKISASYYKRLESFSAYGGIKNIYIWLFLVTAIVGVLILFNFRSIHLWFIHNLSGLVFPFVLGSLEILGLGFLMESSRLRNKNVIRLLAEEFGVTVKTFQEAKIFLLKRYLSHEQHEFGEVARVIQDMLDLSEKYFDSKHPIDKFLHFVFNEEAKTRILTLFVLMCSILTVLTVGAGANLQTLYESLHYTETKNLWAVFGLMLLMLLVLWAGIVMLIKAFRRMMVFASLSIAKEDSKNIEMIKYLIADLIKFHTFNKLNDADNSKLILVDYKKLTR
ncbi:hypothetical protein WCX49_05740 [Sulfurimonas sp. HSL-1656]|uniref:hypothetical protein n=1 Tax=Thiomicrolovo subterrani TaxID=3131934 RepID=UPI0031F759DD